MNTAEYKMWRILANRSRYSTLEAADEDVLLYFSEIEISIVLRAIPMIYPDNRQFTFYCSLVEVVSDSSC